MLNSEDLTPEEFMKNMGALVENDPSLNHFFRGKQDFLRGLGRRAVELKEDPDTCLGDDDMFPKTMKVSLHQQVIYCGKKPDTTTLIP